MPSVCSKCGAVVLSTGGDSELNLSTQTLARLAQLSATNEAPRDAELSLVQPIVKNTRARLASLDAEISRLEAHLWRLAEERTVLARYHAQNTRIISPLRRMPTEILGEIFFWTLPSVDDIFSTTNSPWVLTRVSSRWRTVALSQRSLWAMINADFSVKQHYPLELVKVQLERARSLKIRFLGSQSHDTIPQITLFSLLAQHALRWEELSIQLTSHLIPYVTPLHRNLTSLRRAWVQWDTVDSQIGFDSLDCFRMAISLIDLGVSCDYRFIPTRLPIIHQLARYDFDAPWAAHCQLLKSLPNLREARIRCDFDDDEDWLEPGEPINLAHLQRLYVSDSTILNYLSAPSLDQIVIWGDVTDNVETADHLERFLTRSSCSPPRLCFRGLLDEAMVAILKKYPSFTEIAVTDADADGDPQLDILSTFLTLFTIPNSTISASLFAHITELGFASRNADASLYPLFMNMLESRWNAAPCSLNAAELLFLDSRTEPDPQVAAKLETLREAGLQVSTLSENTAEDRLSRWLLKTEWN